MKGIYSALIAAVLFGSAGAALANDTPRANDEVPSGPTENLSTQTGSANTQAGDTAVKGGTAQDPNLDNGGSSSAQGSTMKNDEEYRVKTEEPRADGEIPSGPDDDMSTQTGSANTEAGDTEVQGGSATQ
ncbi:hypothetical protein [Modicisalibacter luteus]|uniref:Uncharacterized protein n=1 Tax=Modicisalibacter luteus TaxID=453962 RepID=A0ABV7LZN2_9GAMM|nr:hypothetical protein [Halomonas lutea]GHA95070.1 hypothetical protein GCM10007159_15610 [Halomonas lutea]